LTSPPWFAQITFQGPAARERAGTQHESLDFGSGGREHALAWAVKRSNRVTEVVCAPGNGGIAQIARCVPVDLKDVDAMVRVAEAEQPGLTIVGPELPLSLGIVDALQRRGLRVFGPTRAAAMLESSKGFAKRFLQRHNIPTANYAVCTNAAELEKADRYLPSAHRGQGRRAARRQGRHHLRVAPDRARGRTQTCSAASCWARPSSRWFSRSSSKATRSAFSASPTASMWLPLAPAQDHKRIGEGDTGPNTGGMGVYSTDALLDPA
jgi:phosphoribosylamine--glycine ligase